MKFNPFATVGNYPEMLNKISICTFFVALLAVHLLRSQIPGVDNALDMVSMQVSVWDVSIPFGTVLLALVLALLFRVVKLHDRLSDLFKVREHFDITSILMPMALASGACLSVPKIKVLRSRRSELMADVFYRYASSTPGRAEIDVHYITMALDQWCWYWIVLEAIAILATTSTILYVFEKAEFAFLILVAVLVLIGFLQFIKGTCSRYALQEVKMILDDDDRKCLVKRAFDAL